MGSHHGIASRFSEWNVSTSNSNESKAVKIRSSFGRSEDPPIDPGVDQPLQWRAIVTHDRERLKEACKPFRSVNVNRAKPHPEKWADQKSRNDDVNDEV